MNMLVIGLIGICGIFLAILLKESKPEYSLLISVVVCLFIFSYCIGKIHILIDSIQVLVQNLNLHSDYMKILLKIVGITYIAQIATDLCKDAGYGSIANEIQIFGKLSILVISMPVILALMDTIAGFAG